MTNPQSSTNPTMKKPTNSATQSLILGVIGISALALSAVLVFAGGLIPFLICATGPIAIPLILIAFVTGISGAIYGAKALRSPDKPKALAWIGALTNAIVLLIILVVVIYPVLKSIWDTIMMNINP